MFGLELLHSALRVCSFKEAKTSIVFTKELKKEVAVCEKVMSTCYDKLIGSNESIEYFAELSSVLKEITKENCDIKQVVVNTPVYISIEQRNKLERTFIEAGITVKRFLDNSTAAMLANDYAKTADSEYFALVIAMGADCHADVGVYSCENGYIESKTKASINLILDDVSDMVDTLDSLLLDAKIEKDKIQEIVVTGTDAEKYGQFLKHKYTSRSSIVKIESDLVCKGLGVMTTILSGNHKGRLEKILVMETMHTSIGIRVDDNKFAKVVNRKCDLPTKCELRVTTTYDNQTDMIIDCYEGDNSEISGNTFLCQIHIPSISPAPRGVPKVVVTVDICANGIVTFTCTNDETKDTARARLDYKFHPSIKKLKAPSDITVFKPPKMTEEQRKLFQKNMEAS